MMTPAAVRGGSMGAITDLPPFTSVTGKSDYTRCDQWWIWPLDPRCWKYSPSAWAQIMQFGTLPSPPAVQAPAGDAQTKSPASGAEAQATIDSVISQQADASKQNVQNFFSSQQSVAPSCAGAVQQADGSWKCPTCGFFESAQDPGDGSVVCATSFVKVAIVAAIGMVGLAVLLPKRN